MVRTALHRRDVRLAALALVAGAALGACTRAHECRPGTLFLNVHFAPYANVERVFVEVIVAGEVTRSMTFDVRPPGADSGSIEIAFATYPTGKDAHLLVRLEGASGVLATRSVSVELPRGCAAVDLSFAAMDGGGTGGGSGATGAGGTGASAGSGGGAAGTGGGAAGTGGTTGGAGGGAAGTGGAGTGGIAGSGGAGTGGRGGGTAGAGGAAGTGGGRGGTGGATGGTGGATGGTGGAAGGRGGSGGTGGAGGRGGCGPVTTESCFNNIDDDCDGNVDCMDPDCGAVASCVALDPALGQLGVMMQDAQTLCPVNYGTSTTINRGQIAAQCSGCACTPPPVNCVAAISDFPSTNQCSAGVAATQVGTFSSGLPCQNPAWHDFDPNGYVFGVSVGPMTPMYPGCTATGTATAGTPIWTASARFCATSLRGGGCAPGSVCLPAASNPERCVMIGASASCPAGTQKTDWYTGYTGNFACNPCACGPTSGASCDNVRVFVGKNASCDASAMVGLLASGERTCAAPNTLFDPSIVFMGSPTQPTCLPQYTTSGSLVPSGPQTLCCR